MNEIFVDGPGDFTSDGKTLKFTLLSVKKIANGQYTPQDVLQIVCSHDAAKRISSFLAKITSEQSVEVSQEVAKENDEKPREISNPIIEKKRLLSKRQSSPHQ